MKALELKVPPPVVALVVAFAMWVVSRLTPIVEVGATVRSAVAIVIALAGISLAAAGITAFRRARTTLNPHKPDTASALVTGGIYRVTRNPMYLGLALVLVGWASFLGAPWALLGPVVFVACITRLQIVPEERVLQSAFGEAYAAYRARVRRWL